METKTSERRYNTRFRGVPRSVFTYSRKKSNTKSNDENHLRTDIRDDFVYTKLGKKRNQQKESTSPSKKIKIETFSSDKEEFSSPEPEPKSNVMQNGTHKSREIKEVPPLKIKDVPALKNKELSFKKKEVSLLKNKEIAPLKIKTISQHKNKELSPHKSKESSQHKNKESSHHKNKELSANKDSSDYKNKDLTFHESKDSYKVKDTPSSESKESLPSENKETPLKENKQTNEVNEIIIKQELSSDSKEATPSPVSLTATKDVFPKQENNTSNSEIYSDFYNEMEGEGIYFESKLADDPNLASENGSKSLWITSKEKLSLNNATVASYNPKTKMFRCYACQAVGFMSRIGEHYLGTHCNAKVFQCPQCSYCSAWWRCVRIHLSKNHGVSNAPASIWKNQPLLDEIMQILQNLKHSVDCEDKVERVAENCGKRYICPKCPYATDRRDLYNRHENIHREEKPFQCYICFKLFNRADHVKKHFCRIHKEFHYDINLIRRLPSKRSKIPVSPLNGITPLPNHDISSNGIINRSSIPVTQSQLLNCLIGSPTMVHVEREIDHIPDIPKKDPLLREAKNDNTFNKSHSNLLTFLTQNALSPKPLPKGPPMRNTDTPIKDILQEALLKPPGYPSFQSSQPKSYNCAYCPWNGPNAWALRLHTSMHYKTCCVLCNFKSTEASDLENHMWECHKKRSCNKCNFLADSLLALDAHMKEVHYLKPQFSCRHCSQSFEVRSDMEAHCIFIHNQVLQECKENGCDFCTTDPEILQVHKKENHSSSSTKSQDPSASRTLCLYCGCDFADPQSLSLHEELFHENPLQVAGRRPLNPYGCSVCGYSTPKQPMMMEHMRIHTGQTLRCQAGDGCNFDTPYDTVLREHVLQSHSNDDGVVRCPHCGFRCSTRFSFVTHYKEYHHPFCCQLCEDIEHKYFVSPLTTSFLDSSIKAMFPFAKKVSSTPSNSLEKPSEENRRSRKQTQPRKVVLQDNLVDQVNGSAKGLSCKRELKYSNSDYRKREFISLYVKKVRKLAQASLLKCRLCVKSPIYFRHKRNYVLHRQWHCLVRYKCDKCIQTYCHRYQVLLHQREHKKTQSS